MESNRTGLTREEQEVIITTCAADSTAEVYTADPVYIRKLDKLCKRDPDNYKLKNRNEYSATYIMPKKLLGFRVPAAPRVLTEEQRAAAQERIRKLNEKRRINSQSSSTIV